MKEGQYVITSTTGDSVWHETNAKTLRGAKMLASRMYQESYQGRIEVGIARDFASVDTIAVKRGFDGWTEA
jgi:hypothetical protein